SFITQTINWCNIRLSAVVGCYLYANSLGRNTFKMRFEQTGYFFPILIWDQAHTYFCKSLTGNHCFGTFSSVTSPNSVHVQSWANGIPLVGGISFFAIYC